MRRFYIFIYILAAGIMGATAQPAAVKKAAKSVIKITTFRADGTVLATGYGAFTDADGTAIAAWTPFVGAAKAVAIDGQGKRYDVESLCGASEIYNVAKLKVRLDDGSSSNKANDKTSGKASAKGGKSPITPMTLDPAALPAGGEAWCIAYDVKAPQFTRLVPAKVETFMGDMPYYIFEQESGSIDDSHAGAPFVNAQGQLLGLTTTSKKRTDLYVPCARYAMTLAPSALSANDNVLRNTSMRIALPTEYNQALLALMLASQRADSINYPATIDEFIGLFPDKEDGYSYKATYLTDRHDFAGADEAMRRAIEVSAQKENTHYAYSRLIYNKEVLMPQLPYEPWSFDRALTEIEAAIAINPLPLYRIHKGKILFSAKQYGEALAEFQEVNHSGYREPDVWYFAYQCMKNLGSDRAQQLEALDSAITIAPREPLYQAEKALLLIKMGNAPESIEVSRQIVAMAPRYAEGHGLLGLALCLCGKQEVGLAELRRAKALGYQQADALIEKYGRAKE